ncbi:MAG TPA: hypothetical protein EYP18_02220 [Desulfobacterales bacterium]|nr:hypothetical protein [Desulfobacterales bacterium]
MIRLCYSSSGTTKYLDSAKRIQWQKNRKQLLSVLIAVQILAAG